MTRFHTSVTERGSFRDCRRRWHLEVNERLRHKSSVAWALIFGDVTHSGLEAYYKNKRSIKKCLAAFDDAWSREREILAQTYGAFFSMGIEEEWLQNKEMGHQMLEQYHLFDRSHPFFDLDQIIDIAIEERSFIEILSAAGEGEILGRPLLSGKIDLVVKRKNGIWIVDHKTAAAMPNHRALEVDDQLTAYCYIYYRITGEYPRGAVYNVLVKSPPGPPKQLVNGSLSKAKDQRTTYEHYLQEIHNLGLDPVDYEDHLNFLAEKGWRQFFDRDAGIEKSPAELESFEKRLYWEYQDMRLSLQNEDLRYPNPSQRTCGNCSVIAICQAMEEQGDPEYIKENMYVVAEPRIVIPKGG